MEFFQRVWERVAFPFPASYRVTDVSPPGASNTVFIRVLCPRNVEGLLEGLHGILSKVPHARCKVVKDHFASCLVAYAGGYKYVVQPESVLWQMLHVYHAACPAFYALVARHLVLQRDAGHTQPLLLVKHFMEYGVKACLIPDIMDAGLVTFASMCKEPHTVAFNSITGKYFVAHDGFLRLYMQAHNFVQTQPTSVDDANLRRIAEALAVYSRQQQQQRLVSTRSSAWTRVPVAARPLVH